MVVTVFSVLLTWGDVVLEVRASILETGIYFPDGTRLPLPFHSDDIYKNRGAQTVDLVVETMLSLLVSIAVLWDCILPVEVCSMYLPRELILVSP